MVNVLCSHPDIEKNCKNKEGQKPCDVSRCTLSFVLLVHGLVFVLLMVRCPLTSISVTAKT